ncbi:MAG TPA: MoaD/ThiS family protein [Myxococcota bacterium]|nr:MoaD/ThiS family protein [Myxococcota bacterium]
MTISVQVSVFGALRKPAGGAELDIDLPAGANVADAIAACGLEDRVDVWVLVDGNRAGRNEPLSDGAKLTFFSPVGGG